MRLSPQERQRRSDLARRLNAEGRFGGRQIAKKSVEARARKASELSNEIVAKHRAKIERAIVSGLESSSVTQQLRAAEIALKLGQRAEQIDQTEHKTVAESMDRAQLIAAIAEKFQSPAGRMVLRQLPVIEGEAVEITE